jgi:circadian clock protein KaiC
MPAKILKDKEMRTQTGIPGLDKHMEGGFIPGSVNLVSGGTGTGKSLFCMQFLYGGAKDYGHNGLYISMEETEDNLKADVRSIGIDFSNVDGKVKFLYIPPYDIRDFDSLLQKYIAEFRPDRVVIDSLTALTMPLEDDYERKKEVYKVNMLLKSAGCTALVITEVPTESTGEDSAPRFSRFGVEEFMCDGVISLYYAGMGGESDRALRVIKLRRSNHTRGPIPMTIDKTGIKVSTSKY